MDQTISYNFLPIQSLLVASSTGTFQETLTGLPNGIVDTERDSDLFCSITLTSSSVLTYNNRKKKDLDCSVIMFGLFGPRIMYT